MKLVWRKERSGHYAACGYRVDRDGDHSKALWITTRSDGTRATFNTKRQAVEAAERHRARSER